jgi:hypothetical protein
MSDERRRSTRYDIHDATGSFTLAGQFRLIDISVNGLGLEGNLRLQKGQAYRGRVEWAGRTIQVRGRVAWTRLVGTAKGDGGDVLPVYQAGIELELPITEPHGELRHLIEAATSFRRGDRLFGRYRATDDATEVALDAEITIRKVSQTGMQIESPTAVEIGTVIPFDLTFGAHLFQVLGRVVTCEAQHEADAEEPTSYVVGVEFEGLEEDARRTLADVVKHLADSSQDGA